MKMWTRATVVVAIASAVILSCSKENDLWDWIIPETPDTSTAAQITGYVFRPALVPASTANVSQLKLPPGFTIGKFADSLGKPRMLATHAAGHVYFSDREKGTVTLLKDADNNGVSDTKQIVANIAQAHGLYVHQNTLYIAAVKEVYTATINSNGTLGIPTMIINDLPDGGQHPNRTLAIGPDGKLYITVGSTCNDCEESNKLNATIVQSNADGSNKVVYAKGLRNTIGFGWHPTSGELWGMDHGIDWLGDDDQKEELNLIKSQAMYGWPYIYGEGKYNPARRPPGDTTYQQYLRLTTLPVLTYQAHAAPLQMIFYTGTTFPAGYRNDAFITMRGSWNRSSPVGYSIVRLHFENGKPVSFEDFLTGFLVQNNKAHFGRPVGLALMADGSMLLSDDTNGVIYRINYSG